MKAFQCCGLQDQSVRSVAHCVQVHRQKHEASYLNPAEASELEICYPIDRCRLVTTARSDAEVRGSVSQMRSYPPTLKNHEINLKAHQVRAAVRLDITIMKKIRVFVLNVKICLDNLIHILNLDESSSNPRLDLISLRLLDDMYSPAQQVHCACKAAQGIPLLLISFSV